MTAGEKLNLYADLTRRFGLYGPPLSFDKTSRRMSGRELAEVWARGQVAAKGALSQAVYVHVPFCRAPRCSYCMYRSDTVFSPEIAERYIDRLEAEWSFWRPMVRGRLRNLYIGGGTPSLLSPAQLTRLVRMFSGMEFADGGERTCEMSPSTASVAHVEAVAEGGLNRLSLGVQSYDDEVLLAVGRCRDGLDGIPGIVARAKKLRFADVNLDLMLGLKGTTAENVRESVNRAVASGATSVSLYYYRSAFSGVRGGGRIRAMQGQLHAAISAFDRQGWEYVSGDDMTEYHLFYSPERERGTLRYRTSPDCRDNYEVMGLGSYSHGFRPSCLYEREDVLQADNGFNVRQSSVEQQRRIAACNMLYSFGGVLDFKAFSGAFGVSALDCFEDEIRDLVALGRAECDGSCLRLLPESKEEASFLQKFFWDQNYLHEMRRHGNAI